jgi:hypothetical protein
VGCAKLVVFANAPQDNPATLTAYLQTAKPDLMLFNRYPFDGVRPGGSPTRFYEGLSLYRTLGLAGQDGTGSSPVPVGAYTQTYYVGSSHVVSESEIFLNEFSAWTFGFKFVSAFAYRQFTDGGIVGDTILFSNSLQNYNNPRDKYTQVAEANRQSRNLGPALVRLLSTDVRMILGLHGSGSGTVNATPSGVTTGIAGADPYLTSVYVTNPGTKNNGLRGDVILGFFRPLHESFDGEAYSNQRYFMVTNGLTDPEGSAGETQQHLHLHFDVGSSGIRSLERLSRGDGSVETVPLVWDGGTQYHAEIDLGGGQGDLFKYNTGAPFVGTAGLP